MVRAVVVPPGNAPPRLIELEHQLESYQLLVDGFIEMLHVGGAAFVLDEEGKLKGKPINQRATAYLYSLDRRWVGQDVLVGVVVIIGSAHEGADAPHEAVAYFGLD